MPAATETATPQAETAPNAADKPINGWEWVTFASVRRTLALILRLGGLRGLYRFCRGFAVLEWLVNHKRRRKVRRMLDTIYPEGLPKARRNRLVREHFMRQRCDKTFYLIFDALTPDQIKQCFHMVDQQILANALEHGKGCYSLLCHMGAHYVPGLVMSSMGYKVGGIRDPKEGGAIRYLSKVWEERNPDWPQTKVLYTNSFPREIYRALQEGYAIGSALDAARMRDPNLRTVEVDMHGRKRAFLTGTLQIALRCGSPVIQTFIVAEPDFGYRVEFLGPMSDPETDRDEPETLRRILQQYADNIAEYARRYPEQVTRI